MFRKVLVEAAATVAIGAAVLASTDGASARGFSGGGFHGGGFHGGGMRMGGGMRFSGGLTRFGGGSFHRVGGLARPHFRPHIKIGHRWPHWPKSPCWKFPHLCKPHWGGGIAVIGAPVVATAAYAAAAPVAVRSGPVCYECGGWTEDGGFMTYRKVVNEQTGQPDLKCVKVFE
jgi:hypothetical protein